MAEIDILTENGDRILLENGTDWLITEDSGPAPSGGGDEQAALWPGSGPFTGGYWP